MSTAYIYQGFGKYETHNGEEGIKISYAGVPFWLPYQKVTPIPNWTFREVDHDRSTPSQGQVAPLTYQNTIVNGDVIANQITKGGIPVSGEDMGIIRIDGKATGRIITVACGCTADGDPLTADVAEKEATRAEVARAERAADAYKKQVVADFLDSKRQRMSGGNGKTHPDPMTRQYMEELNMEDVDDVTSHQKHTGGLDFETIKAIVELTRGATEVNTETLRQAISTVRKSGNEAQISPHAANGRRSLNLAEKKRQFEEAEAAKKQEEEVKA